MARGLKVELIEMELGPTVSAADLEWIAPMGDDVAEADAKPPLGLLDEDGHDVVDAAHLHLVKRAMGRARDQGRT